MDEMEDSCYTFEAVEIDLDYEFDASRYFDFTRMESLSEVREAESWFESAGSYPPSPYMAKLIIPEDILVKNVNTLPKYKDAELADAVVSNSDIGLGPGLPAQAENIRGWTCYDHMAQDIPKAKTRSLVEAPSSRGSTLMKPTASQLAKQNRPRFHKPLMQRSERTLENPCGNESQAAKRQKLEGGNLRKVPVAKQQPDLIHKVPKKDGHIYNNSEHPRLKITIPREPELETAQRAQRMRPKNNEAVGEHISSTVPIFKARPLNRKILEAPSLRPRQKTIPRLPQFKEFHLKTSERAMQHISSASSSLPSCNNSDNVPYNYKSNSIIEFGAVDSRRLQHQAPLPSHPQKPEVINGPNYEGNEIVPKFKARSLNRKILSSKGDMGIFRTDKHAVTKPMEFYFPTDKRLQNPPIELFSKLSLTLGLKQSNESQFKLPLPMHTHIKGSKENMIDSLQEDKITPMNKETQQKLGGKQIGYQSNGGMAENKISSIFTEACGYPLTEMR
ncbi:hypothetical protein AAC387_Pa08g0448 [Persea americana]